MHSGPQMTDVRLIEAARHHEKCLDCNHENQAWQIFLQIATIFSSQVIEAFMMNNLNKVKYVSMKIKEDLLVQKFDNDDKKNIFNINY